MKTLFPKQDESKQKLIDALRAHGAALDSSHTGVGKTVVACHVAKDLGLPVIVVCPKIVIPHWKRELEDTGVEAVLVTNYEKLKRGTKHLTKIGKKLFRWNLEGTHLIIWDEVHRCAGAFSQNSQMLIAAKQAGHPCLMLSATACQDPTEMRAIGFALGLHSLNRTQNGLPNWFDWMKSFGCRQDPWRKWVRGPVWKLKPLNDRMYSTNCTKLTVADLPEAFAENHVITEPLAFAALGDIKSFYRQHGVTPEIVDAMLSEDRKPAPNVLVEILRARQLVEAAKVPDIVDMIAEARAEGLSPVVFVNFVDTLKALHQVLDSCALVHGGQSAAEREREVQRFQSDAVRVMVCNAAAGGLGVSFHDVRGEFPRISFISPSFSLKEHIQVLGRIHRAGAKSRAVQKILIASDTIEERVMDALEKKRLSMDTLHAQPEKISA